MGIRIGIDTGGTFTDFIYWSGDRWRAFKLPSTPKDPAAAVLAGIAELTAAGVPVSEVIHGSTVATNAVLEGRGARVAFVTTEGFRDLLLLGRQARPSLYDLEQQPLPPLVDRALALEARERIGASGEVVVRLDEDRVAGLIPRLRRHGAEAIAVCLLFSFLSPDHERRVRDALAPAGLPISLSSEVLPEHREYERAVATVVNASMVPVMRGYLGRLEEGLGSISLRVMQSSGGCISARYAGGMPIHTLLSGPAGGVVAGAWAARVTSNPNVVTFDMGGTSTDVSAYEGSYRVTTAGAIGGRPLPVPALDIHTVGAGGGSIARRDAGGALRVGPESAGAEPGPACYGRGDSPTVTDAHLCLGWLDPARVAGGRVRPSIDLAVAAVSRLGAELGLDPTATAEGIVRVADTSMAGALWRITCERGRDPRQFALVAFGGAGPLHACALADRLGIRRVIVPPAPGAFSAFGMLNTDLTRYASRSMLRRGGPAGEEPIRRVTGELSRENESELAGSPITHAAELAIRYADQSYEILVPFTGTLEEATAAFHAEHRRLYGHAEPERPVEIVSVAVRSVVPAPVPFLPELEGGPADPSYACTGARKVFWRGWLEARTYDRDLLRAGGAIGGPAVVSEDTSTTLVPPGFAARVHPSRCLIVEPS